MDFFFYERTGWAAILPVLLPLFDRVHKKALGVFEPREPEEGTLVALPYCRRRLAASPASANNPSVATPGSGTVWLFSMAAVLRLMMAS